jgi:hypothetical protein
LRDIMPKIHPIYLDPVVGYFMWYIGRKHRETGDVMTEQEALDRAMNNEDFRGITPAEFQQALAFAKDNIQASERARSLAEAHWKAPGR